MKKGMLIFPGMLLAALLAGCASARQGAAVSKPDELDAAIREAYYYLNGNIPGGSKILILNIESGAAAISNYVIDELVSNVVNGGALTVVDREQLNAIRAEQRFQLSEEVADAEALAIGKFLGAEIIVSGSLTALGNQYRLTIRALAVETAHVQGQFNRNIVSSPVMNALLSGGGELSAGPSSPRDLALIAAGEGSNVQGQGGRSARAPSLEPAITGILVPGENFAAKLAWLTRSADSDNTYILEVTADESVEPYTFEYQGAENIAIVIRGDTVNRTLSLASNGEMFIVRNGVTLTLDRNITLKGRPDNNRALIFVSWDGKLKMRTGSAVRDNINAEWGRPGGIHLDRAVFEMTGGTISGNRGSAGGGVHQTGGTFTMWGGTISGNASTENGGGINTGHVDVTIRGGTITENTARENGGGAYHFFGSFKKTGGTITGYNSDQNNGNAVIDEDGYALARRGHAVSHVYNTIASPKRRETTLGEGTSLDSGNDSGWD